MAIEVTQSHYARILVEILNDADTLMKSRPLSPMTVAIMSQMKRETLERIDYLTGFLEILHSQVTNL